MSAGLPGDAASDDAGEGAGHDPDDGRLVRMDRYVGVHHLYLCCADKKLYMLVYLLLNPLNATGANTHQDLMLNRNYGSKKVKCEITFCPMGLIPGVLQVRFL